MTSPPARWLRLMTCALIPALASIPVLGSSPASAADPGVPVVPRVDAFTSQTGNYLFGAGTRFVVDSATADQASAGPTGPLLVGQTLTQAVTSLASQFNWHFGTSIPVVVGGSADADDVYFALAGSASQGTEGYTLSTSPTTGARSTSTTSAGAFYAGQTLLQELRVGNKSAAAGTIDDVPDAGYRAVSVDVARNFWTIGELKDLLRRMGQLKLNVLQLHFNENEAFRLYTTNSTYSALAPTSSQYRYSQADIASIVNFAKAYQITVVPEIDTPYHAGALIRGDVTRGLSPECGASYSDTLDILDPAVRTWATGLYQEFLSWFPGPYVHIGNDEVPLSLNNCSYVAGSGKTIEQWQTQYVNELNTAIRAAGKTTTMWANGPDILPDTTVRFVNFGSTTNAQYLRDQGYDVVDTAWGTSGYQRFFAIPGVIRDSRTATQANIYSWTWPGGSHNVGQQLAIWMDFANTNENYSVVDLYRDRLATFAERIWATSAPSLTLTQFQSRWSAVGDAAGVATRPSAATDTTNPALSYTFDSTALLSSSEFTSPPTGYPSSGSRALSAVLGAGGVTTSTAGHSGQAVQFNGSSYQALNIGDERTPGAWTVSMWVKPTAATADTTLFGGWKSALKLSQHNTTSYVGFTTFGLADRNFGYAAPLNTWTHLTFAYDGSAMKLYVNGALQSSVTAAGVPYPGQAIGGQRSITGAIDDLKVFYGALSDAQIAALAQ